MNSKNETGPPIAEKIDHLYRREYGKLVSVLTGAFGIEHVQLAEDVVQDAMLEAVQQWNFKGVPENPMGWIYKVARYKAINVLKKDQNASRKNEWIRHQSDDPVEIPVFTDEEIADDQLRMMFVCCHPSISPDSQIAFTLKTLCGFSIREIATAFLSNEENVNKRLVRARKQLKEAGISFDLPAVTGMESRLNSVLDTIYLLFNEGYLATSGDDPIRYELCEEAIRLTEIIVNHPKVKSKSRALALLSLMLFNTSRFGSRTDESDNPIELEHQDRSKWDQEMINKGIRYLDLSTEEQVVSSFHILAAISAHYCTAPDFDSTDWEGILSLYNQLQQLDSSPLVLFNRAIVVYKCHGAKRALEEMDQIDDQELLKRYIPFYISKAELLFQDKQLEKALEMLITAQKINRHPKTDDLIVRKLQEYST